MGRTSRKFLLLIAFSFLWVGGADTHASELDDICSIRPDLCSDSDDSYEEEYEPTKYEPPPTRQVQIRPKRKAKKTVKNVARRTPQQKRKPRSTTASKGCRPANESYTLDQVDQPVCPYPEVNKPPSEILPEEPFSKNSAKRKQRKTASLSFDSYLNSNSFSGSANQRFDRQQAFQDSTSYSTVKYSVGDATSTRESSGPAASESGGNN